MAIYVVRKPEDCPPGIRSVYDLFGPIQDEMQTGPVTDAPGNMQFRERLYAAIAGLDAPPRHRTTQITPVPSGECKVFGTFRYF